MTAPDVEPERVSPGWTARPWKPRDCGNDAEWEVVKDTEKAWSSDPWFICTVMDDADGATAEANARLIAAAPDLVEAGLALQRARAAHAADPNRVRAQDVREASDRFDAALARATQTEEASDAGCGQGVTQTHTPGDAE